MERVRLCFNDFNQNINEMKFITDTILVNGGEISNYSTLPFLSIDVIVKSREQFIKNFSNSNASKNLSSYNYK